MHCNGRTVAAGEKEELQSVLNAALSRLEAAIGAAQSQEAKVVSLMKQVRACAPLTTSIRVCMMSMMNVCKPHSWSPGAEPGGQGGLLCDACNI